MKSGNMRKFKSGEMVLLVSGKNKWLVKLERKKINLSIGVVDLGKAIGKPLGIELTTHLGKSVKVLKPTKEEFIQGMKKGAQIIYPKDLGAIITFGDIRQGDQILEAGTGSGALTIALLEAVGEKGLVVSCENSKRFYEVAKENIKNYFGKLPKNLKLLNKDICEVKFKRKFDKIVLDLPEPWVAVEKLVNYLVPGGLLINFSIHLTQVKKLISFLEKNGFEILHTFEILKRDWIIDEKRLRPEMKMIGHTGFITVARRLK